MHQLVARISRGNSEMMIAINSKVKRVIGVSRDQTNIDQLGRAAQLVRDMVGTGNI